MFTTDPGAPIAAVAELAGVGMSALYRRYPSKDTLLQQLCLEGLQRHVPEAEAALADDGDAWTAFSQFMRRALEAGAGSLTICFAGSFAAPEALHRYQDQLPTGTRSAAGTTGRAATYR